MDMANQSIRRRRTNDNYQILQPSPSPHASLDAVHSFMRTPSPQELDSPASTPALTRSRPLSPLLPPNTPLSHRFNLRQTVRPWLGTAVVQLLIVLWLIPIAILLWLNLSSKRIGGALWCPKGNCTFNPFDAKAAKQAVGWSQQARDLIGILQLVAKALEVWFIAIASGFIFSLTSFLVVRRTGLPLSLFLASVEFSDIRILIDKDFWLSARPCSERHTHIKARRDWILHAFVALLVLLCIVTNLMGPAVAVLCVPRLQRGSTETIKEQLFVKMTSDQAPHGGLGLWPECDGNELRDGNYTCTRIEHASVFDAWLATDEAFENPAPSPTGSNPGIDAVGFPTPSSTPTSQASDEAIPFNPKLFDVSQEEHVSFVFNGTLGGAGTLWAPNKHVLYNVSEDFEEFYALTNNNRPLDTLYGFMPSKSTTETAHKPRLTATPTDTIKELSGSLKTVLNRRGPAVGANVSFYHFDDFNWIDLGTEKKILCMQGYQIVSNETTGSKGNKCLAVGSDWEGGTNLREAFDHWITVGNDSSNAGSLNIGMILASRARYFSITEQDWSNYFSSDQRRSKGRSHYNYTNEMNKATHDANNITGPLSNVYTIFFSMNQAGDPINPDDPAFAAIEFNPAVAMVKYSLDTSPLTNSVRLVQLDDMPATLNDSVATPIHIHHSWLAALFSASKKADDKGYEVGLSNSPTSVLNNLRIIREVDSNLDVFVRGRNLRSRALHQRDGIPNEIYASFFHAVHLLPLHLMSMLPFDTAELTGSESRNQANMLSRNATIEVWMYGLDSRTSYMGVTVVLIGSLVAIISFCLNLWKAVEVRSPTSLLASALVHVPGQDELAYMMRDEDEVGGIRYRSDLRSEGCVKFVTV